MVGPQFSSADAAIFFPTPSLPLRGRQLLYCATNETEDDGDGLLRGGIIISFPRSDGMLAGFRSHSLAEVAARCRWEVESASSSNDGRRTEVCIRHN